MGNREWMVQDGLGSVRGVADASGATLRSGSYGPYGNDFGAVGTPQTMYGFTGEPMNETGLVHLRARDYNPALGIFTALDPFEGMAARPMSLNRYSWVKGNPTNNVDPAGLFPKNEAEITGDRYQYSCNCGWLDWSHVSEGLPLSLLNRLDTAKTLGQNLPDEIFWGLYVGIAISGGGITVDLFRSYAAVQNGVLQGQSIVTLALSIFMDGNEHFESLQGNSPLSDLDNTLREGDLKRSSFSEEDLVSDLLGFYSAKERFLRPNTPPMRNLIRTKCDALGEASSREVFRYTYGGRDPAPWRQWYPRLPLLIDCSGNAPYDDSDLGRCNRNGRWPVEFRDLASSRIPAPPDPLGRGVWFWLRTEYLFLEYVEPGLFMMLMPAV